MNKMPMREMNKMPSVRHPTPLVFLMLFLFPQCGHHAPRRFIFFPLN